MENDRKALAKKLRDLKNILVTKYSNQEYMRISGDTKLEHIPYELRKLWYDPNSISYTNFSIRSGLNEYCDFEMQNEESLKAAITNLIELLEKFEIEFSQLKKD